MKALHIPQAVFDRVAEESCPPAAEPPRHDPGLASGSYFEVEVWRGTITLFERMGDGRTGELVKMLDELGLDLKVRISSPCG